MPQESLNKQKLTVLGGSKESCGDIQGKEFLKETRSALSRAKVGLGSCLDVLAHSKRASLAWKDTKSL